MQNNHLNKIKSLGYIPVGLGNNIQSQEFITDDRKNNISKKNAFYGEYTFHYWLWRNKLTELNNTWIGFCQYRKFWAKDIIEENIYNLNDLNKYILKDVSQKIANKESIIGEPLFINQFRFSKFIKKNLKKMILNPVLFLDKNKRNIKFHFDMMHGDGNLDKAINLLDHDEKFDFRHFINNEVSFNPHNMFICKSNIILNKYYESVFPWLERCEKVFGFDLKGYGLKRIYGFLAERYMSYWFKKYTKYTTLPIIFNDISELN